MAGPCTRRDVAPPATSGICAPSGVAISTRSSEVRVVAELARVADGDRVALAPLDGRRSRSCRRWRSRSTSLHVLDVEAVARGRLAVDVEVEVVAAGRRARRRRCACRAPPASAASICDRGLSIDAARSWPKTWMPSGLRTPVASISVRVWIGIHQTLGMPGKCSVASILLTSASQRLARRATRSRGLSCTTVSNIPSGAGSVGVATRPALAEDAARPPGTS